MVSLSGQGMRRRLDAPARMHASTLLERTRGAWSRADAPQRAAGLAFHTCVALALLALEALVWSASVWGGEAMQGVLAARLRGVAGADLAASLQGLLASTVSQAWMPLAGALGAVALLWCGAGLAAQWRTAFDALAGVSALPGLRPAGRARRIRDALVLLAALAGALAVLALAAVVTAPAHATGLDAAVAAVLLPLGVYAGVHALLAGRALAAAIESRPRRREDTRRAGTAAIVEQPLPHAVAPPASLAAARTRLRVTPLAARRHPAGPAMPPGGSAVLLRFPDARHRRHEPRA